VRQRKSTALGQNRISHPLPGIATIRSTDFPFRDTNVAAPHPTFATLAREPVGLMVRQCREDGKGARYDAGRNGS
jgi:hypothetical protein